MNCSKHVLIPIDFSATSLEAVAAIKDLSFSNASISLLHVYNPIQLEGPTTTSMSPPYKILPEEIENDLLNKLEQIRGSKLSNFGAVRLYVEISRYPAKAICQFAAREFVDLIIITTRKKNGFSPDHIGSVADGVVRKAPCAVLVMRNGKYQANYDLKSSSSGDNMQRFHYPVYRYRQIRNSNCKED